MYRVEFIGPPGVGKSTICKKVVERLKLIDKDMYLTSEEAFMRVSKSRIDKLYRYIIKILPYNVAVKFSSILINRSGMQYDAQNKFAAEWGKSFESFLRSSAWENMPINDRIIVISGLMEAGSLYECIENGCLPGETVVFFDEGFIQKSFMLISPLTNEGAEKTSLFNYLNNIPLPDLTIHVNANGASCYERMIHRPDGFTKRLERIDKDGILKFLERSDSHIRDVVSWLQKNKNINLLETNNDHNLDIVICDLEQRIKTLFENNFANK